MEQQVDQPVAKRIASHKMFEVYCRFRPLNRKEMNVMNEDGSIILADRSNSVTVTIKNYPTTTTTTTAAHDERNATNSMRARSHDKSFSLTENSTYNTNVSQLTSFKFDGICYEDTDQSKFFATVVEPLVERFLEQNMDANVMTYGQTSSGKTWTVDGTFLDQETTATKKNDEDTDGYGIIARVLRKLCSTDSPIVMSHYEIYCERIHDLLDNGRECKLIETRNGVSINRTTVRLEPDMRPEERLHNFRDILRDARNSRHFNGTAMNENSSRSHTFFEFECVSKERGRAGSNKVFRVIDLAGSERSKRTGATGKTFLEGTVINNSLLYLKQMIDHMMTASKKQSNANGGGGSGTTTTTTPIPKFRETKLTRIIHASLRDGNAQLILILCCSPAISNYAETLNTLRFGSNALKIDVIAKERIAPPPATNASPQTTLTPIVKTEIQIVEKRVGLSDEELENHNSKLLAYERQATNKKLIELERRLKEEQTRQREAYENRMKYYEERTTTLNKLVEELTMEKINLRNELNVFHLFKRMLLEQLDENE